MFKLIILATSLVSSDTGAGHPCEMIIQHIESRLACEQAKVGVLQKLAVSMSDVVTIRSARCTPEG